MKDDFLQRLNISLNAMSALKKSGMLNPYTARILASAHLKANPTKELKMIENILQVSKMFSTPFAVPDMSVDGPIRFALTEKRQPIGFYPNECHFCISGFTGSGKTILLKLIFLQAIALGLKVWLFVRSKENRNLIGIERDIIVCNFDGIVKINPLNPCGINEFNHSNIFADNFIESNVLFAGTENYILENLNELYIKFRGYGNYPSVLDLYYHIKLKKHPQTSRTTHYQESALNRLGGLLSGNLRNVFDCSVGHEEALMENNCIFEIDCLTTDQQRFFVNLMITKLFYHRMNSNTENWMFVGIDDGNLIFDSSLEKRTDLGLPIIHQLLTTVRKSKINIFCCTQTPYQIGASIHSNTFAKVMFSLSNGKDIEFMQQCMGIKNPEQKDYCYKLKPREAIVKFSSRYQEPFLAYIPEVML